MNVIADDLIIAARNELEHDAIMHHILQRARRESVVFNPEKIQFKVTTVTYMGNIVTKDCMRTDPDKIEAVINLPKPSDKHSMLRLLDIIKYLSQYIRNSYYYYAAFPSRHFSHKASNSKAHTHINKN